MTGTNSEIPMENGAKEGIEVAGNALPQWIPAQAWQGYLQMRKMKKKPMTDRALKMAINVLAELFEAGENLEMVLYQSEFNGWTGLFPVNRAFGQQYQAMKNQEV